MNLSAIIPTFGGHIDNFIRTKNSFREIANEVVAVSCCIFEDDAAEVREHCTKFVELPWNYIYHQGFGEWHNRGVDGAKNDWQILLGVAETIHDGHIGILTDIPDADPRDIFTCWHTNDPNRWRRAYNRKFSRWSGGIHESVIGGRDAGLLFEMRDTDKTQRPDAFRNEVMRYLKTTLYNYRYRVLRENPESLGGTDPGWLNFIAGAWDSINAFCVAHDDLISAALAGDKKAFLENVARRMEAGKHAEGVSFTPQGT